MRRTALQKQGLHVLIMTPQNKHINNELSGSGPVKVILDIVDGGGALDSRMVTTELVAVEVRITTPI